MADNTSTSTDSSQNNENQQISFIPKNKVDTAAIKEKQKTFKKEIESEYPGPGHEKPTAHPEKGTLNQEAVDASIKTLKGIKAQVQSISKMLKVEELQALIDSITTLNSNLSKTTEKNIDFTKTLSDDVVVGLCENQVLTKTINSAEMTEIRKSLESLDLTELQKMLISIQTYLQTKLTEVLQEAFGGLTLPDQLDEIMKPFKDLVLPSINGDIFEVVKKILEYLEKLSSYLFAGPLQQMIYLMAWYTVYGSIVGKQLEEIAQEVQKAIQVLSKISIKLTDPNLAKISTLLKNINLIQEMNQKTLNNNEVLKDKINEIIFKERAEVEKIEDELVKKEQTNLPF